ncbi:hypothetical protein ACM66B_003355 [Microbotryomycetes sp. NB124-2]
MSSRTDSDNARGFERKNESSVSASRSSGAMTAPTSRLQRSSSLASQRTTSDWFEASGTVTGQGVFDLPSSTAMAQLQPTVSRESRSSQVTKSSPVQFAGGTSLMTTMSEGKSSSRRKNEKRVGAMSRDEHIHEERDEDVEADSTSPPSHSTHDKNDHVAEESPEDRAKRMYARFSERRKRIIVAIVAYVALLAPFASSSFLPSIPQICDDIGTTPTIINVTVCIYILTLAVVPLVWAPYAGVYGRRPIYLVSLPIFTLGCLGTALSNNLASLIVTRVISGAGSSSVLSVGAGTISDLYEKERRGKAMGSFYAGILIGPAVAPAVAGVLTEYVRPDGTGWRAMQWLLFAMGASGTLLCAFCLPETAHQRGVDLIREERRQQAIDEGRVAEASPKRWWKKWDVNIVWMNPLRPLRLLMLPHILALSLNSSFVLMSTYTVLVPLSQTVAPRYNITNAAILGLFYLAQGAGNLVASPFSGRYADWMLKHYLKKRNGVYVPEDRLRATLIGGGILLPASVLVLGWILDRVDGKAGLALTVVLLFIDGAGLMFVLTPANTYIVDVSGVRSSEAIATNNACRYVLSAAASAFVLPMIHAIGVGATNSFAAAMCWVGCGLILLTIRYGKQMRKYGERFDSDMKIVGVEEDAGDVEAGRRPDESEMPYGTLTSPTGSSPTSPVSKVKLTPLVMSSTATQPATAPRNGRHLHKRTLSTSTRIFVGNPTTPPSRKIRAQQHSYQAVGTDGPSPDSDEDDEDEDARASRRGHSPSSSPCKARSGLRTEATRLTDGDKRKRPTTCARATVWTLIAVCSIVAVVELVKHRTSIESYATTKWRQEGQREMYWIKQALAPWNETVSRADEAKEKQVANVVPFPEGGTAEPEDATASTAEQEQEMVEAQVLPEQVAEPAPSKPERQQPQRLPSEPEPSPAVAATLVETTSDDAQHPPQKYLFVAWMGEQETKAQAHLYQLGLLALSLNRTLVLPQVHQSRFGACYHNDFSLYYEQDTLERFGIPYVSHQDFLEWALADSGDDGDDSSSSTKKSGQLVAFSRHKNVPADMAFMPLSSLCLDRVPVDFSFYPPRAFFSPPTSWKDENVRIAFGESVVQELSSDARLDDDGGAEVLVVQFDLRYPFLTPSVVTELNPSVTTSPLPYSYFEYASFWTKLGQQYAELLSPYVAVHWRTETLPVEALVTCGSALIDKLVKFKRQRPEIKTVYLATDYPLEGLGKDGKGKGTAVAHSGTMSKTLTDEHHDAMRTFLQQLDESGLEWTSFIELQKTVPLEDEEVKSLLPVNSRNRTLSLQELDHAIVGIVDKVVLTQAQIFLAGQFDTSTDFTRRCAKHSQFTEQVVTGRQQFLEHFEADADTTSLHTGVEQQDDTKSPLWNVVGHFAMDEQDDD